MSNDIVPVGRSPYFGIPTLNSGSLNNDAGIENTQHNSSPSAPHVNQIPETESTHTHRPIGFINIAEQTQIDLTAPPPSYDQLFASRSTTVETGTSTDTASKNHVSIPSSSKPAKGRTGRRFYNTITAVTSDARNYVSRTSAYQQRPTENLSPEECTPINQSPPKFTYGCTEWAGSWVPMGCVAIVITITAFVYITLIARRSIKGH